MFRAATARWNGEQVKATNVFRTVLAVRNAAAVILLHFGPSQYVWDRN
jgi:hypothetical protein